MIKRFFISLFMDNIGKILLGLMAISAFLYFQWSQNEIKTLKNNQVVLEHTLTLQDETIEILREDFENAATQLRIIIHKNSMYYKEIEKLIEKFHKNGRSLHNLAHKKPKLVENAVNNGTKEYIECLEKITAGEEC